MYLLNNGHSIHHKETNVNNMYLFFSCWTLTLKTLRKKERLWIWMLNVKGNVQLSKHPLVRLIFKIFWISAPLNITLDALSLLLIILVHFQTYFLPVIGLVDAEKLKPGDLVGVNKDSYLILETLPAEYDARVKAMEVDERPTEQYSDIGGLDKQIQEVTLSHSCL